MGARQSVAQPPRRTQSTSHAHSPNGLAPSTSNQSHNGPGFFSHNDDIAAATSERCLAVSNRSLRSLSVGGSREVENASRYLGAAVSSNDSSSEDVTPGILQLDQLLRFPGRVSLPPPSLRYFDFKCPMCNKVVPSDDIECHLVMCITRPRVKYNEDVLTEDKGECVICLVELLQGDTIARLPCLCVYHKSCIDSWFKVKNSCPEHPGD